MRLAGRFLVIDGPDGCGKTTQIARLRQEFASSGIEVVYAKDPGGTQVGDRIRQVLLSNDLTKMDPRCETLLFMASRAQLAAEVIGPAQRRGALVLGDRYVSSTCAYQAAAGFPADQIIPLARWAIGNTWPDLTVVLDLPVEDGLARVGRLPGARRTAGESDQMSMFADAHIDAMERRPLEFHRRVRANFQALASIYPKPVKVIDAARGPDEVFADVLAAVRHEFS